jgi:hypothetical protein
LERGPVGRVQLRVDREPGVPTRAAARARGRGVGRDVLVVGVQRRTARGAQPVALLVVGHAVGVEGEHDHHHDRELAYEAQQQRHLLRVRGRGRVRAWC